MKNNFSWGLLVNPFSRIAGWKAFVLGFIIVLLTVLVGYFSNVYFPGALDIKLITGLSLELAFLYCFIGIISIILIMFIASLVFAKGTRIQDIIGTVTLSRFPYLLIAIAGIIVNENSIDTFAKYLINREYVFNIGEYTGLIVFLILTMPVIIWQIALLYNAFRVSTGLKGTKCIIVFIGTVLVAEIVSIISIYLIAKNI